MEIRLAAAIMPDSIVDGEGIRTVIWTQGCPRFCHKCHNPETIPLKGGKLFAIDDVIQDVLATGQNVTFSGGDPFIQPKACSEIAKALKKQGLNIWSYTGYVYEELLKLNSPDIMEFLGQIDVLVDGPFIFKLKSLDTTFRGSSNQRLIDVPKSLKSGKTILYNIKKEDTRFQTDVYL